MGVVWDVDCTLPRAFISAYVGLETSSHHEGSRIGLGMFTSGALFRSRSFSFPLLRPSAIEDDEVAVSTTESMVWIVCPP